MSKISEKIEKDNMSNESNDSRNTKSERSFNYDKERKKVSKKKMILRNRSAPRGRLSGGADSAPSATDTQPISIKDEVQSQTDSSSAEAISAPETPSTSPSSTTATKTHLITTGDPRADEMLECALHNLEEAGKAMANLVENLEHELKLFLVELMNRTRKWTGQVESKIEWTRRDILELNKELGSRITALHEARRESVDLKDKLAQTEKSMMENMKNQQSELGTGDGSQQHPLALGKSQSQARAGSELVGTASGCQSRPLGKDADHFVHPDVAMLQAEGERLQDCCAQLEAEILDLKKENEKIVKERAEYENAIQRALLKGVSSLNVEALKVLRCTPIPSCCPPCAPSSSVEPITKSGRDCTSPTSTKKDCPGRSVVRSCGNDSRESLHNESNRRNCPGSRSERKSKKSKDQNLLLLLHQKDAESFGIQEDCDPCANLEKPKKSTIYGGGYSGSGNGKHGRSSYGC